MNELALEEGEMYLMQVQIPGVWQVPRESCMRYIGAEGNNLLFSARPRLGTQEVQRRHIIKIAKQPHDALVFVAWKTTSRTRPEKWRYQR